jgi:hypothetical protein
MRYISNKSVWEAAMLVLLMGGIYEVSRLDDFRCHDDRFWHSSKIKVTT